MDRQQSEAAANCKTVGECTKISQTARTGLGFSLADAQAMCGGVQGCIDFATDLGRRDVYDEINARDVGYANALAARRAQLLAAGLDPNSATIGAGITPGDAASAVGGIAGAALGGIRGVGGASEGPVFKTTKEATQTAEALGYRRINETVSGQAVYTDGKNYISRDIDSHNGGAWKLADSVKSLGSKETRSGTFNANLTERIGN